MKNHFFIPLCCFCLYLEIVSAQCSGGETAVTIQIETDLYGYEGFWALYPASGSCTSAIASGGNATDVGCNGAGQQDASAGNGYAGNQTILSGPHCLNTGEFYVIEYVDDYEDGNFKFTVLIEGLPLYRFEGNGSNNIFTFKASPALPVNAGLNQISTNIYYPAGDVPVKGKIYNYGSSVIYSLEVNYSVNNGAPIAENLSGLSVFPYYNEYEFSLTNLWHAEDTGSYTLKVWASLVNGQPDLDNSNDTLSTTVIIGKPVPNLIDQYLTDTLTFTVIGNSADGLSQPRDLDFHPVLRNYQLWVINEGTSLGGSTVTFFNAGKPGQSSLKKVDENVYHFMLFPTGIAFSENTNFAISPGVYDANHGTGPFTGPSLWSSDMSIYAEPTGPLGSHIDMLHQSPFSMGIAAEKENAFWVFDGDGGNIVRYDFRQDHGPGNDDHSDGLVWRYTEVQVQKLNNDVPSHLVLDEQKKWLYIVDGGNKRVLRMDITTGSPTGNIFQTSEPLAEYKRYTGVTWEAIITTGLSQPCGIDVMGDRLLVSDYSNGDIIIYNISVQPVVEMGRIQTGQPGIQGIKIGPDGLIWYVNRATSEVVRIDGPEEEPPVNTGGSEVMNQPVLSVTSHPAHEKIRITLSGFHNKRIQLAFFNLIGENLFSDMLLENSSVDLNLNEYPAGSYLVFATDGEYRLAKKIVIVR